MVIGLLNFGEGLLALNYLIFCTVASLGVLQFVAGRARLVGLMVLPAQWSRWLGAVVVVSAYVWFFSVQPDLFIPGLAGGEFFTLFAIGFLLALALALAFGVIPNRVLPRPAFPQPFKREETVLNNGLRAELWLPRGALPPLVFAFRESETDSLDVLSGVLVAGGAAVLLVDESLTDQALEFVEKNAGRFHPTRRYAIGVGRGADRALQLSEANGVRGALALGPLGRDENAQRGLRWLRETDYLTAWSMNGKKKSIPQYLPSKNATIIFGDEDTLLPPAMARELFPNALMVAGARHFTLAAMPATIRLALDLFELRAAPVTTSERVLPRKRVMQGEMPD